MSTKCATKNSLPHRPRLDDLVAAAGDPVATATGKSGDAKADDDQGAAGRLRPPPMHLSGITDLIRLIYPGSIVQTIIFLQERRLRGIVSDSYKASHRENITSKTCLAKASMCAESSKSVHRQSAQTWMQRKIKTSQLQLFG